MADYSKLSIEEIDKKILENTAKKQAIREDSLELHRVRDQKLAEKKLEAYSDDELQALAQVIRARGIDSEEAVNQ